MRGWTTNRCDTSRGYRAVPLGQTSGYRWRSRRPCWDAHQGATITRPQSGETGFPEAVSAVNERAIQTSPTVSVRIPLAKSADPLHHPPKHWGEGPTSWVRTGIPGPAACEQTANADFANGIRPFDEVGQHVIRPGLVGSGPRWWRVVGSEQIAWPRWPDSRPASRDRPH